MLPVSAFAAAPSSGQVGYNTSTKAVGPTNLNYGMNSFTIPVNGGGSTNKQEVFHQVYVGVETNVVINPMIRRHYWTPSDSCRFQFSPVLTDTNKSVDVDILILAPYDGASMTNEVDTIQQKPGQISYGVLVDGLNHFHFRYEGNGVWRASHDESKIAASQIVGGVSGVEFNTSQIGDDAQAKKVIVANASVTNLVLRGGSTLIKSGPGLVERSLESRLIKVFDVIDYGADDTGVADSTTAFQGAVDAAIAAGGGRVWIPRGTYTQLSGVIVDTGYVTVEGDGNVATLITFTPASPGLVAWKFSNGAAVLPSCGIKNLRLTKGNNTLATAIELDDVSNFDVHGVTIGPDGGWTGSGSIGLNIKGRELIRIQGNEFRADRPVLFSQNPNRGGVAAGIDIDASWTQNNIYVATAAYSCLELDDVNLTEVAIEKESFNQGTNAIRFVTTTATQTGTNLKIRDCRYEQCTSVSGWSIYIDHNYALQFLLIDNFRCDEVSPNGIHLRNTRQTYLTQVIYGGNKIGLETSDIYQLRTSLCGFSPSSTATLTDMVIRYQSSRTSTLSPVADSGYYVNTIVDNFPYETFDHVRSTNISSTILNANGWNLTIGTGASYMDVLGNALVRNGLVVTNLTDMQRASSSYTFEDFEGLRVGYGSKAIRFGYDTTNDKGIIQASNLGAGGKDIVINYLGGNVGVGTSNVVNSLTVNGAIYAQTGSRGSGGITADDYVNLYGTLIFGNNSRLKSATDSTFTLFNAAEDNFNRLNFGGNTISFPSLKRSGGELEVRLADDSGYTTFRSAGFEAANITQYRLMLGGASGLIESLGSVGSSGDVLTSQGAGAPPVWAPPGGGSGSLGSDLVTTNNQHVFNEVDLGSATNFIFDPLISRYKGTATNNFYLTIATNSVTDTNKEYNIYFSCIDATGYTGLVYGGLTNAESLGYVGTNVVGTNTYHFAWYGGAWHWDQDTAQIPATLIGAGTVDNTELGYLNGVTSAIQTQLAGKQSSLTFTNGVTNISGVVSLDIAAGSNVTLSTNNGKVTIAVSGGGALTTTYSTTTNATTNAIWSTAIAADQSTEVTLFAIGKGPTNYFYGHKLSASYERLGSAAPTLLESTREFKRSSATPDAYFDVSGNNMVLVANGTTNEGFNWKISEILNTVTNGAAVGGGGGGLTYLINENCELSGTPSGWTDIATIDWDNVSSPLSGSESMVAADGNVSSYDLGSTYNYAHGKIEVRFNSGQSGTQFITARNAANNATIFYITVSATDISLVDASGTGVAATTLGNITTATKYFIWYDFAIGTGANGTGTLDVSTTDSRPTGGGGHATYTDGTGTTAFQKPVFGVWSGTHNVTLDNIQMTTTTIP